MSGYCLAPKLLYLRTFTSEKTICRRLFQHNLVGSLGFSITDAVVNYTESHTHEDLKLLDVTRITLYSANLHIYITLTSFTLYKEKG